jgi:hypothetical protein
VLCDKVVFDVDELSVGVYPFEGVAAVAVVEAPSLGGSMIAEKHEACVVGFGGVGKEIEEGVVIKEEVCWIAVLRADDVWSLNGITAEEDGLDLGQFGMRKERVTLLTKFRPTMS